MKFQDLKSPTLQNNYTEALAAFAREMMDDLKTPMALAVLNGMVHRADELGADSSAIAAALPVIESYFGLRLTDRNDISDEQKELIAQREKARGTKDWSTSDQLRDQLKEQGIGLRDTDSGAIWYRL